MNHNHDDLVHFHTPKPGPQMRSTSLLRCLYAVMMLWKPSLAFVIRSTGIPLSAPTSTPPRLQCDADEEAQQAGDHKDSQGRRQVLTFFLTNGLSMAGVVVRPQIVLAGDEEIAPAPALVEMKEFVDPVGYFSIRVPQYFFTIRRSTKGDLPDPKTGEGRRGSSIFTAGDMNKAELVAVERFPTRSLLEENGIEATGDLSTFTSLGEPAAVANLLSLRRDRDKAGKGMSNTQLVPGSIYLTSDGMELSFKLKTEIEVQKPELLLEQYGVFELYRITTAKASLRSNDGNLMAVYASALETDFNGPDGLALQEAVNSFQVMDRSAKPG